MIVVVRAVELVGLLHQGAVSRQLIRLYFQQTQPVRNDVQVNRGRPARIQIQALEVTAREYRRVHKVFQGDRFERGDAAASGSRLKSAGELPAAGQPDARLDRNLTREIASWVKHNRVPLQVQHLRRHDNAAFGCIHRGKELELDVQRGHSHRHIDVESEHIHRVAGPFQARAVGPNRETGKLVNLSSGRMITRQPLRIQENDGIAATYRDRLAHAENVAVRVGRIDTQADCPGIRRISWGSDCRWHR